MDSHKNKAKKNEQRQNIDSNTIAFHNNYQGLKSYVIEKLGPQR
jgi:hypothetical protein